MNKQQKAIAKYLESSTGRIGKALSDLVRISSVNPYSGDVSPASEAQAQRFLDALLREAGCQTRFLPVPKDVYRQAGILGPRQRNWSGRENLVARYRFGKGEGPVIVLNAHADTVGVSDYDGEPFSGTREGDIVHGRGASDCKGGLVAGLFAIRALQESGASLCGQVIFESVVDEECNGSGAGTLACCQAGIRGKYALVLDGPAGLLYTGCQGVATVEISVRGRAGHGSFGGVNAVEKLLIAKKAIDQFARERARRHPEHLINVGVIRAGHAPWTVPDRGWLAANINYAYEEAAKAAAAGQGFCGLQVRERFEKGLAAVSRKDEWLREHPAHLEWVKDLPPFRIEDANSPADSKALVAAAKESLCLAWGKKPKLGGLCAWCDASHVARVGRMPVVGMGAGEPGVAHTAMEWNRVSNVRKTAAALALTMAKLCTFTA